MLQSQPPLYLIDGQQPLLCAKHWALLTHPPTVSRHSQHQFLKSNLAGIMPPFELEESMQLRPWVLPSQEQLTEDEVTALHHHTVRSWQRPCSIITYASDT